MSAPYGKPLDDLRRAEVDAQVVALKRQDLSFAEIGRELEISKAAAHRAFHRAVTRVTEPEASAYRADHLARLALAREVVLDILAKDGRTVVTASGKVIEGVEDDGETLSAVDRLIKLDEREARLLGIDAEQKVNLSGGIRYEVVGVDGGDLT